MKNSKAFTLIELLVVISIIAMLLTILMPSLGKVKMQARRVICATNLHQWSIAFEGYSADNDTKNLITFGYTEAGEIYFPVPNEFWLDAENYTGVSFYEHPGQFCWELMAPYMPSGFNTYNLTTADVRSLNIQPDDPEAESMVLDGVWTCPSYKTDEMDIREDVIWRIHERGFMRLRYSYFGRVDEWFQYATHPEDFSGMTVGARDLIMADALYNWSGWLDYNHHESQTTAPIFEYCPPGTEPSIGGINKLYGDGSVSWKDRREYMKIDSNPNLLDITNQTGRRVMGEPSNASNFY